MKKLFFIAIIATGMLFACNSNDTTNDATSNTTSPEVVDTSNVEPVITLPTDSLNSEVESEDLPETEPLKE